MIALTHFAPFLDTVVGEPPEIYRGLGCHLLAEAVDQGGADLALHGHAHHGSECGWTPGGLPSAPGAPAAYYQNVCVAGDLEDGVALQMDPEQRRKLMELARWHDQWQAEHQVDDAEFVPEGADGDRRRPPTPEAEREFMARAREIMGLDAETGHRQGLRPTPLPVARTRDEAHLYMDMHPCGRCGGVEVAWDSSLTHDGGAPARRYSGTCGDCGEPREFVFAVPDRPTLPGPDDVVVFGGPEPSKLLDPGEWLLVADLCAQAAAVPQDAAGQAAADTEARYNLAVAAAAAEEVLKFVPPGADAVPEWAFFSDRGLTVRQQEPGRFRRSRLLMVRDTYRDALARLV